MLGYRKIFYKNYFQTQISHSVKEDIHKRYAHNSVYYEKDILPLLPFDKNCKILEFGCGYGELLLYLKNAGFQHAEGIDVSEEQVAVARQLGLTNVTLGDVNDFLGSCIDKYDVIIGMDIIEHFTKDELCALLEKIKKSLKSNGILVLRTANSDAPFASTFSDGDFTHECILNYASSGQLMLSLEFKDVKILPSFLHVNGIIKNLFRKLLWGIIILSSKIILFASGRSTKRVVFTPLLLIYGKKK